MWANLMKEAKEEASSAIMDYGDPEMVFTGGIAVQPLNIPAIDRALKAYEQWQNASIYPKGWKKTLEHAKTLLLKLSSKSPLIVRVQHDGQGVTVIPRARNIDQDPKQGFTGQDL